MSICVRLGVGAWTGRGLPSGKGALSGYGWGGLLGAVRGAHPALRCGRGSPWRLAWRGALGPHRASPARGWRAGGRDVAGWSGSCGPMRPVWRRARGPFCRPTGRGNGLGGKGRASGLHRFGGRHFEVAGHCPGLLSWRPNRDRGLRQPPLLPLCGGFPQAFQGTRKRERDRRWCQSSCWGEPLESDIAATLTGVRGCRRACATTSQCIRGVLWVVLCGAGGEGVVAVALGGHGAMGDAPALGREEGKPLRPHAVPQLSVQGGAQGSGPSGVVERLVRGAAQGGSL